MQSHNTGNIILALEANKWQKGNSDFLAMILGME